MKGVGEKCARGISDQVDWQLIGIVVIILALLTTLLWVNSNDCDLSCEENDGIPSSYDDYCDCNTIQENIILKKEVQG